VVLFTHLFKLLNCCVVDSNSTKRRGRTQALSTWEFNFENKLMLSWDVNGLPVGPNAVTLATFVGSIVRKGNLLPLTYSDWRSVPKEDKEKAWSIVKVHLHSQKLINVM